MAQIERQDQEGVTVLRLSGVLDQAGGRTIERALREALDDPPDRPVVADMSGVLALSTSGISLLLGAMRAMERDGRRFILSGTQGHCQDVLRRCRLDVVFATTADLPSAIAAAKT